MKRELIGLLVVMFVAGAAVGRDFERWYIVELDGHKAGWGREVETTEANGAIVSTSEMHLKFLRMGQHSETVVASRSVENAAGDLVSMSATESLGAQETIDTYRFIHGIASNDVQHESETVAGKKTETLPWPKGEWLAPVAARRLIERELAAGAEKISYQSLDPSAGLVVATLTQRIVNRNAVADAAGKTVPAIEWEVTNSLLPGVLGHDFVDSRGVALRSELNMGGMKMVILASEKEAALSEFGAPEMMARTLVRPGGKRILDARGARRCVFTLSMADGSDMPDVPSVGAQVAERIDAQHVRVTVLRGEVSIEPTLPESFDDPSLRPSSMITSDDKWVRDLARGAGIGLVEPGDEKFAESLTRGVMLLAVACVAGHIDDETLGVGFATAAEVARTGRGDCTEHAVLLAAILRAAGIPSRVVSGLVYVTDEKGEGIFGYHMWVQARQSIEPTTWIDVDAAILPTSRPARGSGTDATHIALATSTMADGEMINSMAAMVGVLGRLKIEVLEAD